MQNYVGIIMDVKLEQSWNAAEGIWNRDVDRTTLCNRRLDSKAPLYKCITILNWHQLSEFKPF